MSEKEVLLSIENLIVEYSSDAETVHAVNDVSLQINKGQTLGLVGETGAGKTTIAKAILQILPDPPAKVKSGRILMDGDNLMDLKEDKLQKIRGNRISMIFQDPMTALNPTIMVGKQIMEAISLHEKLTGNEARRKAEEMLEKVGIPKERYSDYPHQFSGGMKQRVIIAIALSCNPELLLADEPTTALDVTIQAQVLDMMNQLKQEFGTSVLMITHDLGIVAETCDCVAVIYAGEIVEYGTAEEIFDYPTHPYTVGLFGSLPNMTEEGGRLSPIEGMMPDPTELPEGCKFAPRCKFATDECRKKNPELKKIDGDHKVRCVRPGACIQRRAINE